MLDGLPVLKVYPLKYLIMYKVYMCKTLFSVFEYLMFCLKKTACYFLQLPERMQWLLANLPSQPAHDMLERVFKLSEYNSLYLTGITASTSEEECEDSTSDDEDEEDENEEEEENDVEEKAVKKHVKKGDSNCKKMAKSITTKLCRLQFTSGSLVYTLTNTMQTQVIYSIALHQALT